MFKFPSTYTIPCPSVLVTSALFSSSPNQSGQRRKFLPLPPSPHIASVQVSPLPARSPLRGARPLRLEGLPLLAQGDPDPEPADDLDEGEGEEDPVLEAVAAPGAGGVARVVHAGGWVGHPPADGGRVAEDGARGREDEGVGYEAEGDEEADGGWVTIQVSFSWAFACVAMDRGSGIP